MCHMVTWYSDEMMMVVVDEFLVFFLWRSMTVMLKIMKKNKEKIVVGGSPNSIYNLQ